MQGRPAARIKPSRILAKLNDHRMIAYRHPTKPWQRAALRSAASLATGARTLPFDADLEYPRQDIEPVLKGTAMGRSDE
jgi:hypothetical protein